jgi:hypothetical protein
MHGKLRLLLAALGLAACLWGGYARAQGQYRPAVSPYLNLTRPGNPGVNYYNLVRPQFQFGESIQGLQQQVGTLGAEVRTEAQAQAPLPTTGHPVQFMSYSHYFAGLTTSGTAPGAGSVRPRR